MARTGVLVLMVAISGSTSTSGGSTSSGCASVVRTGVGASAVVGNLSTRTSGGRNRRSKARFMSTILDYKSAYRYPSRFLDHVEKSRVQ